MLKGKLVRWNDEKGFGFVRVEHENRDVFIHISALKNMGRRPVVGDVIYFDILVGIDGKDRAVNASIDGVKSVLYSTESLALTPKEKNIKAANHRGTHRKPFLNRYQQKNKVKTVYWLIMAMFVVIVFGYDRLSDKLQLINYRPATLTNQLKRPSFQCQGKTRCTEMSSCEEAMFYLNNCPGTEMDGDRDGIPCEQQWCN